jgi:hypothetical protein
LTSAAKKILAGENVMAGVALSDKFGLSAFSTEPSPSMARLSVNAAVSTI